DLRQRIGLIHELRELRRAEELLDDRAGRLVVDQLLRHQGFDILQAHPLLDGPLHTHQADAELVLDQLTHGAYAPVAEVIDIVDLAIAVLELDQVTDYFEDVFPAQGTLFQGDIELELVVELEAADPRQVVALGIEEQVVEEGGRGLNGRGIAGSQAPIDFDN